MIRHPLLLVALVSAATLWLPVASPRPANAEPAPAPGQPAWINLFDGKSTAGWAAADYDVAEPMVVRDGQLVINTGTPMAGIVYQPQTPHIDYELELVGQRVAGSDFFCGLTFPVRDDSCSLVLGGWGGGTTGLSTLDGMDASENETTGYYGFQPGVWYTVRLQVTQARIVAIVDAVEDDGKPAETLVNVDIRDRKIDIRIEMEPCRPMGIATYRTTGAFRQIRMRPLTAVEIAAIHATPAGS